MGSGCASSGRCKPGAGRAQSRPASPVEWRTLSEFSADYIVRGRHAYPRHSIPMARLVAWLARRRDLPANLQCKPQATS